MIWFMVFSTTFNNNQWFSPFSSPNKTDHHDITKLLLKVVLNTINQIILFYFAITFVDYMVFVRFFSATIDWQKSDIWSQASYRYDILWKAFLDPSDSYFLFADLVGFYMYTH
jgi:hypothetical protein